jgi:hypothetical protein
VPYAGTAGEGNLPLARMHGKASSTSTEVRSIPSLRPRSAKGPRGRSAIVDTSLLDGSRAGLVASQPGWMPCGSACISGSVINALWLGINRRDASGGRAVVQIVVLEPLRGALPASRATSFNAIAIGLAALPSIALAFAATGLLRAGVAHLARYGYRVGDRGPGNHLDDVGSNPSRCDPRRVAAFSARRRGRRERSRSRARRGTLVGLAPHVACAG